MLLTLPHEVLHSILLAGDNKTLIALSRCCRALHGFIKHNQLLHKELYLLNWDPPVQKPEDGQIRWDESLLRMGKLQHLLESSDGESKKQHLAFVANAVDALLNSVPSNGAPSLNMTFLQLYFAVEEKPATSDKAAIPDKVTTPPNVASFMCQSTLFRRAMRESPSHIATSTEDQLSAKLHCLYGVPIDDPCDRRHLATYPFACSKVYDLRNYSEQTVWGPFIDDGWFSVDWEKVEAIMVVLAHNLRLVTERTNNHFMPLWTTPFAGASPNSYMPLVPPRLMKELTPPLELQDPYNITGTYMRVVCFLDYTEFYDYNFVASPPPPGQPRPPLDTDEATRLIIMRVKATKAEAPGEEDGQGLPVMHFTGTSHSMHAHRDPNANSRIRGTVRLTKEGEVRWTSFSIYFGEERWRSEGIQVGGVGSARGVFGHWFDKDFSQHGPAGPTALWKISDAYDEKKGESLLNF
ncbi:hypothetical protein MMC18_002004 [Xylographa bjoerkii]|nr:hypothetical protein [Xylographa bjoerkii]